jgi:NAD(P)H-nitrite reductase large subunit
MLGQRAPYTASSPPVTLKVPGIDLVSVGTTAAADPDGLELQYRSDRSGRYGKLIVTAGHVQGAILIGHPELVDGAVNAVTTTMDVRPVLGALKGNDWSVLTGGESPESARLERAS